MLCFISRHFLSIRIQLTPSMCVSTFTSRLQRNGTCANNRSIFRLNGRVYVFRQGVTIQSATGSPPVRICLWRMEQCWRGFASRSCGPLTTNSILLLPPSIPLFRLSVCHPSLVTVIRLHVP